MLRLLVIGWAEYLGHFYSFWGKDGRGRVIDDEMDSREECMFFWRSIDKKNSSKNLGLNSARS